MNDKTDLAIQIIFSIFGIFLFFYLITDVPECNAKTFEKGNYFITISGNSMFPTLKNNSICSCEVKDNYKVGDIILFAINDGKDKLIIHRMVYLNNDTVITRGDNNKEEDYKFTKDSIICSIPNIPRIKLLKNS